MLLSKNKKLRVQYKWIQKYTMNKTWIIGNTIIGAISFMSFPIFGSFFWNTLGVLILLPIFLYCLYTFFMLSWIKEVMDVAWLCSDFESERRKIDQEIKNETFK